MQLRSNEIFFQGVKVRFVFRAQKISTVTNTCIQVQDYLDLINLIFETGTNKLWRGLV